MNQTSEKLLSEQNRIKEVKRQIERALLSICRLQPDYEGVTDLKLRWRKGHLTGGVLRQSDQDLDWDSLSQFGGNGKL